MMQPAHGYGPASSDLSLQAGWCAISVEVGLQAQAAQRQQLRLRVGAVPVFVADRVIGVIIRHLAPVHREHGATRAETLAVAGARFIVELALPPHLQRVGSSGWLDRRSGPIQRGEVFHLLGRQHLLQGVPGGQLMRLLLVVLGGISQANRRHLLWCDGSDAP